MSGPLLEECLRTVRDEEGFTSFITGRFEDLDPDLVRRIVRIVGRTYGFAYTRRDPVEHRLAAPLTIYRARGDELSFFESGGIRPITRPRSSTSAPTTTACSGNRTSAGSCGRSKTAGEPPRDRPRYQAAGRQAAIEAAKQAGTTGTR